MVAFLRRRWFLIALAIVIAVGFGLSPQLAPWTNRIPRRLMLLGVMLLMALPMDASTMGRALRRPGPVLLSVAITFGMLPLVAWGLSGLLAPDLGNGLMIAAAIPCTLASAAVWTRRAGGNDAVAIMVTMITNLVCFVVTPAWLVLATGQSVAAAGRLEPTAMVLRLGLFVVLPIVFAQLLRLHRPLAAWATDKKVTLNSLAQCGILTMLLIGCVKSGTLLRGAIDVGDPTPGAPSASLGPGAWTAMIVAVIVVHVSMLVLGHVLGRLCGFARPERIAVGFAGSQKTLMVGLDIAVEFVEAFGELSLLPMVAYHVSQLLIDTLVVDKLRQSPSPEEIDPGERRE